jgi:hypothetical protein
MDELLTGAREVLTWLSSLSPPAQVGVGLMAMAVLYFFYQLLRFLVAAMIAAFRGL